MSRTAHAGRTSSIHTSRSGSLRSGSPWMTVDDELIVGAQTCDLAHPQVERRDLGMDAGLPEADDVSGREARRSRGDMQVVDQDGRPRAWYRDLDKDLLAEEERFLAEKVYDGGDCGHERIRIDYSNRFSDRV